MHQNPNFLLMQGEKGAFVLSSWSPVCFYHTIHITFGWLWMALLLIYFTKYDHLLFSCSKMSEINATAWYKYIIPCVAVISNNHVNVFLFKHKRQTWWRQRDWLLYDDKSIHNTSTPIKCSRGTSIWILFQLQRRMIPLSIKSKSSKEWSIMGKIMSLFSMKKGYSLSLIIKHIIIWQRLE